MWGKKPNFKNIVNFGFPLVPTKRLKFINL